MEVDIPTPASILAEAAGGKHKMGWQGTTQPETEALVLVGDGITVDTDGGSLEGNPAEGMFAMSPTQLGFVELASSGGVFFGDGLDGLGVKRKKLGSTGEKRIEVISGEPATATTPSIAGDLVAIIPHEVYSTRHHAKMFSRG